MSPQKLKKNYSVIVVLCLVLVSVIYNGITSNSESNKKIMKLEQTIENYETPLFRDEMFACMANQRRFYEVHGSPSDELFAKWYDSEYGNLDDYCQRGNDLP